MITRFIGVRVRYSAHQKEAVRDAVTKTIAKKGIVVSHARTAKGICSIANYNCSIGLSVCKTGKA